MELLSNPTSRVKGAESSIKPQQSTTERATEQGASPDLSQASFGAESSKQLPSKEDPQVLLDKLSRGIKNDLVILHEIVAMYEEEVRIRKEIDQCEKRSLEMLKNGDAEGAVALARATAAQFANR